MNVAGTVPRVVLLVGLLLLLTCGRLFFAIHMEMHPAEALFLACAAHPESWYVEGGPGMPLLLAVAHLSGLPWLSFLLLRVIPSLCALVISWAVWRTAVRIAPGRTSVAFWSVASVNVLPAMNFSSVVNDGAMVTVMILLLGVVAGWRAADFRGSHGELAAWTVFGVTLAVGTLFWLPCGILLPAVLLLHLALAGWKGFPWRGGTAALGFLILAWAFPLSWSKRHDGLLWDGVASSWSEFSIGAVSVDSGPLLALGVLFVPFAVRLVCTRPFLGYLLPPAFFLCLCGNMVPAFFPRLLPRGIPSPLGVSGLPLLSETVQTLRNQRPDASGGKPFLVASTPGLAALLGPLIAIDDPERPGVPPVFAAESPSLSSSYAFWPGYADAVSSGGRGDPLYTEERWASPFLGRNALYITEESLGDLPQTITGAFGAVALLEEVPVLWQGKPTTLRIFQCEDYQGLSL